MSLNFEMPRLDVGDRGSQKHLEMAKRPAGVEINKERELLLEQDRATLLTLFEWLTPGRKTKELYGYVTLLFRAKRTDLEPR